MARAVVVSLVAALSISAQTYSREKEIALGRQLAAEFEGQSKILEDPTVSTYVARIAGKVTHSVTLDIPPTVKLLDARQPELIVLPGSFLYLSSGLIVRLETEAELAGVLAHAAAHLAARHGIGPIGQSNVASVPIIIVGTWRGVCSRLAADKVLLPATLRATYARWEVEADELATGYLRGADYDPVPLAPIFERLRVSRPQRPTSPRAP